MSTSATHERSTMLHVHLCVTCLLTEIFFALSIPYVCSFPLDDIPWEACIGTCACACVWMASHRITSCGTSHHITSIPSHPIASHPITCTCTSTDMYIPHHDVKHNQAQSCTDIKIHTHKIHIDTHVHMHAHIFRNPYAYTHTHTHTHTLTENIFGVIFTYSCDGDRFGR